MGSIGLVATKINYTNKTENKKCKIRRNNRTKELERKNEKLIK